jgi:serine/threonine-protein kinase PknG
MEFVGGWTLERIKKEAAEGRHQLPMENIVLYGLQLLRALRYLHERGYLYCDLKPDNVIHGSQVRLIDLGAVRAITDKTSATWGAPSFRVGDNEIRERGLTVRSDLYSVGTTLQALFRNSSDDRSTAERNPIAEGLASFRAVLERATSAWEQRFESAADMAEQLTGVLRQITALRGEAVRAEPSRVFAQPFELFDAGLGVPPSLSRWTRPRSDLAVPRTGAPMNDGRPDPAWVAVRLPDPLIDPEDLAAPVLVTVSATDLGRLLEELQRFPPTIETALLRSRVHLALYVQEGGDGLARAREDLTEARAIAGGRANWRIHWHSGLLTLVEAGGAGDLAIARKHFELVHRMLPGETTPMLALAFCAEAGADRARAEVLYHTVLVTDRSWASAAFGLARIRLAAGDRNRAVAVLDEISPLSRYFDAARTAAVQIRIGTFTDTGPPELSDLHDAAHRLMLLSLDEAPRIRLATLIQQAALEYEHISKTPIVAPGRLAIGVDAVLGDPMTSKDLKRRLERSFRRLARQAPDRKQRVALVDLANAVRPWSLI